MHFCAFLSISAPSAAEDIAIEVEIASGVCFDGFGQATVGHVGQVLARAGKLTTALLGVNDVVASEGYEVGKG